MEARRAADDSWILAEPAVPVQFDKLIKEPLNVVERMGSIGMPRELYAFDRSER